MIISSTIPGKFTCNGKIIDFNPLIDFHNLTGYFVLMHWNKIERLFGYYDGYSQKYFVVNSEQVDATNLLHYPLSVPSSNILPTDVIMYPEATCYESNNIFSLVGLNNE